ncbi:MAG: hypothetical protein ABH842_00505 [Candidatus Micrarchaeota archaeon]
MRKLSAILVLLLVFGCISEQPTQNLDENVTTYENTSNLSKSDITTADKNYSIRFGINGGLYSDGKNKQEFYLIKKQLDDTGPIWLRHLGKVGWFDISSQKGEWDWELLDNVLLNDTHPWVIEIFGSTGTVYPYGGFSHDYLTQIPRNGGTKEDIMNYIKSYSVNLSDPQQLVDTEEYVKTFVLRYKDQVKYWEISNEGINAPNRYELIKYCYKWIKEVHPDAIIILTGIAGDDDEMFDTGLASLDTMLANGIGDYFDVGNFHYYGKIETNFEKQLEDRYYAYDSLLKKYNLTKPIWVTETSTSSATNSVLSGPSSEKLQAQHLVKRFVVFAGMGAEKVFWHSFKASDIDNKFYECNLVDQNTNQPKPAYYTFKLLMGKIGYFQSVTKLQGNTIRLYKFTNSEDVVFVAWSTNSSQTLDLSSYLGSDSVLVTHLLEERNATIIKEELPSNNITITESPIFIEELT